MELRDRNIKFFIEKEQLTNPGELYKILDAHVNEQAEKFVKKTCPWIITVPELPQTTPTTVKMQQLGMYFEPKTEAKPEEGVTEEIYLNWSKGLKH